MQSTLKEVHTQLMASVSHHRTLHSRTNFDKTCQLTGTVRGPTRRPHFFSGHYLCNRSTLDIGVLGYIGIFIIRNTLLKSGTFFLGHPVYPVSLWNLYSLSFKFHNLYASVFPTLFNSSILQNTNSSIQNLAL
jgi:hypothetical protein